MCVQLYNFITFLVSLLLEIRKHDKGIKLNITHIYHNGNLLFTFNVCTQIGYYS